MKLELSRQIFEKCPNIKFYENLPNGSRVFPCGGRDGRTDRQTERHAKLVVVFRSFAKAPKKFK
jgi:hypothetical protein